MTYGICDQSIVSMRSEPSHKSEMVSQLLFGEYFEIKDQLKEWIRICHYYDNYEGWILASQCFELSLFEYSEMQEQEKYLSYELVQLVMNEKQVFPVPLTSVLPWFDDGQCRIGQRKFDFDGNARIPLIMESSAQLLENAYMYLNAPYLWGGKSPFGIDCSGFTQMVFKLSGIKLMRDAGQQSSQGIAVNFLSDARPGDLAFFENDDGKISHVGIIIPEQRIIHASGRVRIDNMDTHGIFNVDTKRYSHKLRVIKRVI